MQTDILALLKIFEPYVRDRETHAWVVELARDEELWPNAHDVFSQVRRRRLAANESADDRKECQYAFEEACLKSLFNETSTDMPFDTDVPHWILKNALSFARAAGIPDTEVIAVALSD